MYKQDLQLLLIFQRLPENTFRANTSLSLTKKRDASKETKSTKRETLRNEISFGCCTLQLETATMLEILDKPGGSCPANIGLAGCADIVTFTFFTQGSTTTTSFACFSNYKTTVYCIIM